MNDDQALSLLHHAFSEANGPLLKAAFHICRLIKAIAGGRALFVGGCVRDALLGIPCKDIDIEVYHCSFENIVKALAGEFELNAVGVSFGVLKVKHFEIDIALPRVENKTGAGHRGFLVTSMPELPFPDACARRDFTINAMLYDPLKEELIDPWHGLTDLKNKVLRHVSSHFSEDPLRVLRAMQFSARTGYAIASETVELCRHIPSDELAPERIAGEWEKLLLKGKKLSSGLQFLKDCTWITQYPELDDLTADEWAHLLVSADRKSDVFPKPDEDTLPVMLALLCRTPEKAGTFVLRIWRSPDLLKQVQPLTVARSMTPTAKSDPELRRLAVAAVRPDRLCLLLKLENDPDADRIADGFRRLQIDRNPPDPLVLGRHLQSMGIASGPLMGKLLKECFEAQLDGKISSLEEGLLLIQNLISSKFLYSDQNRKQAHNKK